MVITSYSDIYIEDSTLRPYQQKAKRDIFESWDKVDNVMFQMPTGTGKTRLFTSLINDINEFSKKNKEPVKILIIAHRTELIKQIVERLKEYAVPCSMIAGREERNYKLPVQVASIQTLTHPNNLEAAKKLKAQFVIIDEAHHALALTYKKLWDLYPGSKKLGVTATPWRMNHQSFLDLFDFLITSMPVKDFISQGYLSQYKYYSLKENSYIQKTIDEIKIDRFGEYSEKSMEEKMDIGSIRAQLLKSYLSFAKGKKGIIYAINIKHANHIGQEYEAAGFKTVSIDSQTPASQRDKYVDDFKKGEIDIIVNVDIFSEGFDCPDIEFIQLARPTRSLVKYLQQVGRGLRPTKGKDNCIILDNVGMYSRFGLPDEIRDWKKYFVGQKVEVNNTVSRYRNRGGFRYVDLSEGSEAMELILEESSNLLSNKKQSLTLEDIQKLKRVFEKKQTSYTFFWLLSLLHIYKETNSTWIKAEDVLIRMLAEAWKYVSIEGVQFRSIDKIPGMLKFVQNLFYFDINVNEKILCDRITKCMNYEEFCLLFSVLREVPYRFLSPWIPFKSCYDVEEKSVLSETKCLYRFSETYWYVIVNEIWKEYLLENYDELILFSEMSLKTHLKIYASSSTYKTFYRTKFKSLNQLAKAIQDRKNMPDVQFFCSKFDLPLKSKLIPADILERVPDSGYTTERNGQRYIDVKEGQWSLKMLEQIFAKK